MKLSTKEMSLVGLFAGLIAIGAFIKIPFFIVPITLQTLFVTCSTLVLGKRLGTLSVIIYLIIGLIGIPVFTKGGGLLYVLQPTFGYLIGFVFMAYFIGKFNGRLNRYLLCFIGLLITYLFGLIYFIFIQYFLYGISYKISFLFINLFLVFIPGDLISSLIAVNISKRLNKIIL